MVRFAHIADVHLGGWKQQALQKANFNAFQLAIEKCIQEKPDFVLIAGDLFDAAYPPIEILKDTFAEFRKLREESIPVFHIAGSHDYSVSGKTFLDVLERAGFCQNVENVEEVNGEYYLSPVIFGGVALYGYPGRKSGLEIEELKKVKFNDAPGLFKIFMLHTTLDFVVPHPQAPSLKTDELPDADYYALGHIHVVKQKDHFVYPGPIFPNNFQELEDLKQGGFFIVDTTQLDSLRHIPLPTKRIERIVMTIEDTTAATDEVIDEMKRRDLQDAIVLLRIKGVIKKGKQSDINYQLIEETAEKEGAYVLLRNTHDLQTEEFTLSSEIKDSSSIEEETIRSYVEENPSDFNSFIPQLMQTLSMEKQEDEKSEGYIERLLDETKKVLQLS